MLEKVRVFELCDQFEKALCERNYSDDLMYRYRKSMREFKAYTGDVIFSPHLSAGFLTTIMGEGFSTRGVNSKLHMYYVRTVVSGQ